MIMPGHLPFWRRILDEALPARGRWITIGVQDIHAESQTAPGFNFVTLTELLQARGIEVQTLDLFDDRANISHDLNQPLPPDLHEQFDVLLDIGTIEHVFDTRQVFINYLSLVKPGGHLCLHVPVAGYYRHGLHTFSPELIRSSLLGNGCQVSFEGFSDYLGNEVVEDDLRGVDALLWVVADKVQTMAEFRIPQQAGWKDYYEREDIRGAMCGVDIRDGHQRDSIGPR